MKREPEQGMTPIPTDDNPLQSWLCVGGDLDDFIFFGEDNKTSSER